MLRYLELIKTEMEAKNEGDKYKSEGFEDKQKELAEVISKISDAVRDIGLK